MTRTPKHRNAFRRSAFSLHKGKNSNGLCSKRKPRCGKASSERVKLQNHSPNRLTFLRNGRGGSELSGDSRVRASARHINSAGEGRALQQPQAGAFPVIFSVYFSLSDQLPQGRGLMTALHHRQRRVSASILPAWQLCHRVPSHPQRPSSGATPQDAAPRSHYSPSTFINKLPLITAVIAKLFRSSNYSSQPDPGYLSGALSPKMA